ncbi:MAG: hypothetical protein QNJ13_14185 [Paracoccaceae bacterium]|nr:hypothetical protein [Paracoccaceae bacterium]
MPFVLAAITLLGGAYFWYLRAQNARDAVETLAGAAQDVRLAARRYGFRRKANVHPADAVEDPRLAIVAMAAAVLQMDAPWSVEAGGKLTDATARVLGTSRKDAEAMVVFAKWLSDQSGTHAEMVRRLAKRLNAIGANDDCRDLAALIEAVAADADGNLSDGAVEALGTINRVMR